MITLADRDTTVAAAEDGVAGDLRLLLVVLQEAMTATGDDSRQVLSRLDAVLVRDAFERAVARAGSQE